MNIDEELYSRQLYTIGKDAMKNMSKTNIYINGMNGLGLEIAKCIILSGMKTVNLNDNREITNNDLSSGYYYMEEDNGKKRVDIAYKHLSQLNPYVNVTRTKYETLNEEKIKSYDIIVLCDVNLKYAININNICRGLNKKFIYAQTYGLMGFVYCDFGNEFTVIDNDGELNKSGNIIDINYNTITNEELFITNKRHELIVGDIIKIFNNKEEIIETSVTKVYDNYRFITERTIGLYEFKMESNITFNQIKQLTTFKFKSLEESILDPEFVFIDMCDFDRPSILHSFVINLNKFIEINNRMPYSWNETDVNNIMELYKNDELINENIIRKLTYTCAGDLCPINSIIGSITAQEVIKAAANKYTPIKQWLYFDGLIILPEIKPIEDIDIKSRYYRQEMIFGKEYQQKIKETKVFIIGAGAIGCEHLKNLVMMGIGDIIITDMDIIEKSNLNRQFLFRNTDIGQFKSEIAVRETKKMNKDININYHLNKIGKENINIYNETFYNNKTCIINALDNIEARQFMDNQCIIYKKPLLESGTLGTKGNIQTIIPYITETYGTMSDPIEETIPVCTIKFFPYLSEHTIQWAMDIFEGIFIKTIKNYNKIYTIENFDILNSSELSELYEDVKKVIDNIPTKIDDCIIFAYILWHKYYYEELLTLINKYPLNCKNENGTLFWSKTLKYPNIATFDIHNMINIQFIYSFSKIWANIFNINNNIDIETIQTLLYNKKYDIEKEIIIENDIKDELIRYKNMTKKNIKEQQFEKDNDMNYHIDFIMNASNIRASIYGIKMTDKFETKGIAGKIIPAIATTTSLVSGLVALELYKIIYKYTNIERYRNVYINLAISFMGFTEPRKNIKKKIGDISISIWDDFIFENPTIEEIINYFNEKNIEIAMIMYENYTLFSNLISKRKYEERIKKKIITIYNEILKIPITYPLTISIIPNVKNNDNILRCKIINYKNII